MATKYDNVIVFGPTGATGGAAALEASSKGAKVWLAMRDTSKSLGKVGNAAEDTTKFQKIQADLTDPASLTKAVQESKAKAAYVYLIPQNDHRASFAAMQAAGVEWIVLLSTMSIGTNELRSITQADFISWFHAQGEIALEDLGLAHAAVRPGFFASNPLHQDLNEKGQVNLFAPGAVFDAISPDDIGRVAGNLLVSRPPRSSSPAFASASATNVDKLVVNITGPKLITRREMWETIAKVTGKQRELVAVTEEEEHAHLLKQHIPPPIVDYLIKFNKEAETNPPEVSYPSEIFPASVQNVKTYTGRESTSFEDFVKENIAAFSA